MKQRLGTRFHYDHSLFAEPMQLDTLKLFQIGELCLEPGFEVLSHNQICWEISYIISGKGTFLLNGDFIEITAGDIIITPNSGQHSIQASDNEALFYAYIGFNFNPDNEKFGHEILGCFRSDCQTTRKDRSEIYTHFRRCMDEFYHIAEGNRLVIEACLTQIIVWTCRNLTSQSIGPSYETCIQNPGQLVYRMIRYIDRNISKPLTVMGIADSLGYSPYYISHLFKEKTGQTLQNYISTCKIEKAKELIGLQRFTLTEIAEKLSYSNLQSFSRIFRAKTNLSPSAYQKNLRKEM